MKRWINNWKNIERKKRKRQTKYDGAFNDENLMGDQEYWTKAPSEYIKSYIHISWQMTEEVLMNTRKKNTLCECTAMALL